VLDFGAGSGITTIEIAKRIGRHGLVVAIDLSEKQLIKAVKKSRAIRHPNIIFMRASKTNFKKNSFDAITMVNVLEHLKYPEKELKTIFCYLRKGGRFSALSFGKSFGIPAPEHISSREKIKKLFAISGLNVNIKVEKKKFTEYWYIWGRK
jgi:ubiquinone/menaquinone biosynthesis C-methylase UbiE